MCKSEGGTGVGEYYVIMSCDCENTLRLRQIEMHRLYYTVPSAWTIWLGLGRKYGQGLLFFFFKATNERSEADFHTKGNASVTPLST